MRQEQESEPTVALLSRAGCHLCDEAREVIERVALELGVGWVERDLDDAGPHEREEYWDKIPVTFVRGRPHDFWTVDERRLRAALQ
jgi:glutaredoxin